MSKADKMFEKLGYKKGKTVDGDLKYEKENNRC